MNLNRWMRTWVVFSIAWAAWWLFYWVVLYRDQLDTAFFIVLGFGPALVYAVGYGVAWIRRGV
jgi:hypothetical protein